MQVSGHHTQSDEKQPHAPKEPEPIFLPMRYLPPTRRSVAMMWEGLQQAKGGEGKDRAGGRNAR